MRTLPSASWAWMSRSATMSARSPGAHRRPPRWPRAPLLAHRLDDGAADAALGRPGASQTRPSGAGLLGQLRELVDLLARAVGHARAARPTTRPPAARRSSNTPNPEPRGQPAEVVELHAVAQVRLVDAVAVDRLAPGQARERDLLRMGRSGRDGARDGDGHLLHPGHDVLLATKLISRSSWVNSGWRSPRRSSSRKQRAIWK